MGFPDNWCDCTIPYNQYSLYGNALVPVCVEWIVKRIGLKNIDFGLVKNVQLQMALNG
jgi:DNA (cytosine-5)-methyltransferase 1